MRSLPLVASLVCAALLVSAAAEEEDDEVVLVEDVDEDSPRRQQQHTRSESRSRGEHRSGSSGPGRPKPRSSGLRRRPSRKEAANMTSEQCFKATDLYLRGVEYDLEKAQKAGGGYVDNEELQRLSKDAEEGVSALGFGSHMAKVERKHQSNPSEVSELHAQAGTVSKLLARVRRKVADQVGAHQDLMSSTLEIIARSGKTKNLHKYIESRLKAKPTADLKKRTSSLDNIKEMLRAQKDVRAGGVVGLTARELTRLAGLAFAPFLFLGALRAAALFQGVRAMTAPLWDVMHATLPPAMAAAYAVTAAGPEHLAAHNYVAIVVLTGLLTASQFVVWMQIRLAISRRRRGKQGSAMAKIARKRRSSADEDQHAAATEAAD
eukprot:TRINITY_DN6303_c0_g2_i3.p1 TRINITY_DN6303_c0_g2~~TRINITY_DN6303_c0_g2_i3.p1  ORF type:complete len:378 (+),score=139.40 TRINITY_DN6303_c0_g2_i3:98-1231(+)